MIKSELVLKIVKDNPHLSQRQVERIVNSVFEEISEALARGHKVELRGFGTFSVREKASKAVRRVGKGEGSVLGLRGIVRFTQGSLVSEALKSGGGGDDNTDDPGPGVRNE